MKDIRRKCNSMVNLSKFTFNKKKLVKNVITNFITKFFTLIYSQIQNMNFFFFFEIS